MKNLILFVFIFLPFLAYSQPRGCLDGSTTTGTLYTNRNPNNTTYYTRASGGYLTSAPACPRVRLIERVGTCRFGIIFTYDEWTYEILNPPVQCDIDHYALGAIVIVGIIGVRKMRNKYHT